MPETVWCAAKAPLNLNQQFPKDTDTQVTKSGIVIDQTIPLVRNSRQFHLQLCPCPFELDQLVVDLNPHINL